MVDSSKNNRGQILVLVAISLVVLLGFAALAIDLGYFYHTKNQLQGAADAAALAGAIKLNGTSDLTQTDARTEAVTYAGLNTASGSPVHLSSDGSNALSENNNITVGSWATNTYSPGVTPVNAVQVKARSTDNDTAGFPRIFGKIFDTTKQNINTYAIAARPARSSGYISFCADLCNAPTPTASVFPIVAELNPPRVLDTGPTGTSNYAWTSLNDQSTNANGLIAYICGEAPFADSCGNSIFTTMGGPTSVLRNLEAAMYDPTYESNMKGIHESTGYPYWWVTVPYTAVCPPGTQPDPQPVIGYAQIRIIAICAQGGGGGSICRGYSAPAGACAGYPNNVIVIDRVTCASCAASGGMSGWKSVLVQ